MNLTNDTKKPQKLVNIFSYNCFIKCMYHFYGIDFFSSIYNLKFVYKIIEPSNHYALWI